VLKAVSRSLILSLTPRRNRSNRDGGRCNASYLGIVSTWSSCCFAWPVDGVRRGVERIEQRCNRLLRVVEFGRGLFEVGDYLCWVESGSSLEHGLSLEGGGRVVRLALCTRPTCLHRLL